MRHVSEINPQWLNELAPHYFNNNDLDDDFQKKLPKSVNNK